MVNVRVPGDEARAVVIGVMQPQGKPRLFDRSARPVAALIPRDPNGYVSVRPLRALPPTTAMDGYALHSPLPTRSHAIGGVGGQLSPNESLAVARHPAHGFGWGDGGSGAAQLALALLLRATDRASAVAHYQAFKWEVIARLPQADFTLALSTVRDWLASRSAP